VLLHLCQLIEVGLKEQLLVVPTLLFSPTNFEFLASGSSNLVSIAFFNFFTDSLFFGLHHLTFFSLPSLKRKSRDESKGESH